MDHDGDACVCVVDGNFTMIRCDAYQSKLLLLCGDEEILLLFAAQQNQSFLFLLPKISLTISGYF